MYISIYNLFKYIKNVTGLECTYDDLEFKRMNLNQYNSYINQSKLNAKQNKAKIIEQNIMQYHKYTIIKVDSLPNFLTDNSLHCPKPLYVAPYDDCNSLSNI